MAAGEAEGERELQFSWERRAALRKIRGGGTPGVAGRGWGAGEPVWLGPGESGAGPRRGRDWPSRARAAGASVCASVRGRARAREEAPECVGPGGRSLLPAAPM